MRVKKYLKKLLLFIVLWVVIEVILIIQKSWIVAILVVFLFFGLVKLAFYLGVLAYRGDFYGTVDLSHVDKNWIKISSKDSFYWAATYKAKHKFDKNDASRPQTLYKKPYVIVAHGMGGNLLDLELMSIPMAMNGYNVVAFNQAGHGGRYHRSPGDGKDYSKIMTNIHDVVEFVKLQEDLACDGDGKYRIGFVGGSTGGIMSLTQAYLNPDIKVTIALSHIHDFNDLMSTENNYKFFSNERLFKLMLKRMGVKLEYTEEENKIFSPKACLKPDPKNASRVFILHCENDPLPISEALKSKALADLPDENCLFLKRGGHAFRGQETILAVTAFGWIKKNL